MYLLQRVFGIFFLSFELITGQKKKPNGTWRIKGPFSKTQNVVSYLKVMLTDINLS